MAVYEFEYEFKITNPVVVEADSEEEAVALANQIADERYAMATGAGYRVDWNYVTHRIVNVT